MEVDVSDDVEGVKISIYGWQNILAYYKNVFFWVEINAFKKEKTDNLTTTPSYAHDINFGFVKTCVKP